MEVTVYMEYVDQVLEAVSYIESNLDTKLEVDKVSSHAGYSKFHFQRLFHQVTNRTIGQYVLGRKLTEAARMLRTKNYKVVDVAYSFGFESHESFTRAFKGRFGISPSDWKMRSGIPHHLFLDELKREYLAYLQHLVIEAVDKVVLEEKHVRGFVSESSSTQSILTCWNRLLNRCGHRLTDKYGLIQYADQAEFGLTYRYLASSAQEDFPDQEGELTPAAIPKSEYIVFHHRGPVEQLPLSYRYIYGDWFNKNKYELHGALDFEHYGERYLGNHPDSLIRILVPVN